MKRISSILAIFAASAAMATAQQTPLWLRSNSISPDGSKVAFTYKGNIYIVNSDGGDARQLTTNPAYDTAPIWTPDGQNIVFCSTRERSKDIFMVSEKGGSPKRITTHPGNETPVAILNDGTIIFSAAIEQDADVVMFIYREDYYNGNKKEDGTNSSSGVAQVSIAKHRNGATGLVELLFLKDVGLFSDYSKREE